MLLRRPRSTLFPYTTLFRSLRGGCEWRRAGRCRDPRGAGSRRGHAGSRPCAGRGVIRSEEHTSELQSRENLVCRLLLEKKKKGELDAPKVARMREDGVVTDA